jgi:hypothetical protein
LLKKKLEMNPQIAEQSTQKNSKIPGKDEADVSRSTS